MTTQQLLAAMGLTVALYALYTKNKLKTQKNHKPFCDINKHISCSKALSSAHANLILIPNALWGVLYYTLIIISPYTTLAKAATVIALAATLFLATISYGKQKNFCLLCTATYILNIMIAILVLR